MTTNIDPNDYFPTTADDAPSGDSPEDLLKGLGAPIPPGYRIPAEDYRVDASGVWDLTAKDAKRIASAPCLVVGIERDDADDELVELAWLHYGIWRRRPVARAIVRSGRRLVTALGDAGFPIMDSTSSKLEAYLDSLEAANRAVLPVTRIARRLGWQRDGTFVVGSGQQLVGGQPGDMRPVESGLEGMEETLAAYHPAGTLEGWQDTIRLAEPHPIALMALYAGLAAPLLEVLGLPGFTLDLSGQTSTGKTTSAELGLSAWADPLPATNYWNSSQVYLETRLALVYGLPVVIDETAHVDPKKADIVTNMLFAINQGREKGRGAKGGGLRRQATFQTIAITTGEQPILSFTGVGGASARTITLESSPFGDDHDQVAIDVRAGCYANYGIAGPVFAAKLVQLIANREARDRLRLEWRETTEKFRDGGGTLARRRAPSVAALHLAATLAYAWNIVPFPAPALETWLELFGGEDPRDDRPGLALEVVQSFIAANPHRLSPGVEVDDDGNSRIPAGGWLGKQISGGRVGVRVEVVREELRRAGYNLEAVKHIWAKEGLIEKGSGRNIPKRERLEDRMIDMLVFPDSADNGGPPEDADEVPERRTDGPSPYSQGDQIRWSETLPDPF